MLLSVFMVFITIRSRPQGFLRRGALDSSWDELEALINIKWWFFFFFFLWLLITTATSCLLLSWFQGYIQAGDLSLDPLISETGQSIFRGEKSQREIFWTKCVLDPYPNKNKIILFFSRRAKRGFRTCLKNRLYKGLENHNYSFSAGGLCLPEPP